MPNRPERRSYFDSEEWEAIRQGILARAGNCCERCGAPNHIEVLRVFGWWTGPTLNASIAYYGGRIKGSNIIPLMWRCAGPAGIIYQLACFPSASYEYNGRFVRVVLTIVHLNGDIQDDRAQNLQAQCQHCRLTGDVRFARVEIRRREVQTAGKLTLMEQEHNELKPNHRPQSRY